jgi:hypothetical protein
VPGRIPIVGIRLAVGQDDDLSVARLFQQHDPTTSRKGRYRYPVDRGKTQA